jgi:hypothetical protein
MREATALERLGLMLDVTANMAQSREALEQSIQAYWAADNQEGLRRSLARLMRVYRASGIPPEVGLARLEAFLPLLLDGEASAGRAMLHVALARLYSLTGRFYDEIREHHGNTTGASQEVVNLQKEPHDARRRLSRRTYTMRDKRAPGRPDLRDRKSGVGKATAARG